MYVVFDDLVTEFDILFKYIKNESKRPECEGIHRESEKSFDTVSLTISLSNIDRFKKNFSDTLGSLQQSHHRRSHQTFSMSLLPCKNEYSDFAVFIVTATATHALQRMLPWYISL